jgi:hypothetical protein
MTEGPNRVSPLHLPKETDPVSGMLCSLVFIIPDNRQVQEPSYSELNIVAT